MGRFLRYHVQNVYVLEPPDRPRSRDVIMSFVGQATRRAAHAENENHIGKQSKMLMFIFRL